jgi:hypothetical protein
LEHDGTPSNASLDSTSFGSTSTTCNTSGATPTKKETPTEEYLHQLATGQKEDVMEYDIMQYEAHEKAKNFARAGSKPIKSK